MKRPHVMRRSSRRDRESGQAVVEFALILFPLLILVVGIIQFGIALNYWLDANRLANQGARFAIVNNWPGCPLTQSGTCSGTTVGAGNSLPTYLKGQATTAGLNSAATVSVCYPPTGDPLQQVGKPGAPVRVTVEAPFRFQAIMKLATLNLKASATMRLEQDPTHLVGVATTC